MAHSQDRGSAKLAEVNARKGIAVSTATASSSTCRAPVARTPSKVVAVVIPVFRSLEEIRGPAGTKLLQKVELPLDTIRIPLLGGRGRGGLPENDAAPDRRTDSSSIKPQDAPVGAQDAGLQDVFAAASAADAVAAVAAAITGLLAPNPAQPQVASPTASAVAVLAAPCAAHPPRRPPGFPSPEPADDGTVVRKHMPSGPPALKPSVLQPAPYGTDNPSRAADSSPAAPGTPPERIPAPCERSAQENSAVQSKVTGALDSGAGSGGSADAQGSSPAPPCTPRPTLPPAAATCGPLHFPGGTAPPPGPSAAAMAAAGQTQQHHPQTRAPGLCPGTSGVTCPVPVPCAADGSRSTPVMAHVEPSGYGLPGQYGVGHGPAGSNAAYVPYAYAGYPATNQGYMDPLQQQQLAQQLHQQLEFQQQIQYQQQQQHHLQQQYMLQQQQQQQQQHYQQQQAQQQRQAAPTIQAGRQQAQAAPSSSAQRAPDQLRPPQRPRPCAAFGADSKGVEVALARALTSLFRKDSKLFRDVYGFDLDWWIDARGKPLGESCDDLLVAMVFHNYAAVMVRLDRGAAPGWAGHYQMLNPTMSTLLNEKIYGNALMLRAIKQGDPADLGAGAAMDSDGVQSGGPVLHVRPLTPEQVHSCVKESDNVAWQLEWYRELAPGLAQSLSNDERETWLSRLPLAPLDEEGKPDMRKALALIRDCFKVPSAMARPPRAAAGAVSRSKGGAEARAPLGKEAAAMVPPELAPLLRHLRCTSPWCTPSRQRGAARRGGRGCCPFGHFWRSLDLERSSKLPPVFNAARHCAKRPLEPELCPSLIDRLSQLGWGVALPGAAEAQAVPIQELSPGQWPQPGRPEGDVGFAGELKADGIFAPGASEGSGEEEEADGDEEEDEEDTPEPPPASRQLRLEDLTFYLSFCREGPRCRRCHSFDELQLAEVLQRLTGGGGKASTSGALSQVRTRPHRRGFEVLAALLDDSELHGQGGQLTAPDSSAGAAAAAAAAAGDAATQAGAGPPATGLAAAAATGTIGSSFKWADEPEASEPEAPMTAAPWPAASQHHPSRGHARATLAPRQHGTLPSLPLPVAAAAAHGGTGMGWSSRAPISCHPAAAAAAAREAGPTPERRADHDLRPMPKLPESLDLEPLPEAIIPDRTAVAASMAAKSRNGVYIAPHLRAAPGNEEVDASAGDQACQPSQAGELPPAEPQRPLIEPAGLPAVEPKAPSPPPPPVTAPLAMEPPALAAPLLLPHASAPAAGLAFGPAGAGPQLGYLPLTRHLTSLSAPAVAPPRQMSAAPNNMGLQPLGFHQAQAQPPPVPVPVPVTTMPPHAPAQLQGRVLYEPRAADPSALGPHNTAPYSFSHAQAAAAAAVERTSAGEPEDDLVECMSFCGLSLADAALGGPASLPVATQQAGPVHGGYIFSYVEDGRMSGMGGMGGGMADAPPPPPSAHPQQHVPQGMQNLHPEPPPYAHAQGNAERPAGAFPSLFSAPPPGVGFAQPNGPQPFHWVHQHQLQQLQQQPYAHHQQQQHQLQQLQQQPYAPPAFVQGPFIGGGPPLYNAAPGGLPQAAWLPPPMPPYAPPQVVPQQLSFPQNYDPFAR